MLNRRDFLKLSTAAGAVLIFPRRLLRNFAESPVYQSADQVPLDPLTIPKFAHDLTIPLVFAPKIVQNSSGKVIRHEYDVFESHTRVQMLPLPFPMTTVLGYGGKVKPSGQTVLTSPGPVFEAIRGIPTRLTRRNNIVEPHFLPVDPVLHWANPNAMEAPEPPFEPFPPGYPDAQFPVPHVTHIHGLVVAPQFDGTAEEWFTAFGHRGPSYVSNVYDLPNEQPSTQLFYHDHAMGITRLNVYAGLVAPAYFIRDPNSPLDGPNSPLPKGEFEISLAIADRAFFTDGELNFPRVSDNPELPYWQAETEADVVVVNGKAWPDLKVKRRQYRFRMLGASNERLWTFGFAEDSEALQEELEELAEQAEAGTITKAELEAELAELVETEFVPFTIIGSDGGYLPAPKVVRTVTMGITERADVLVDFSQFAPGTQIIMRNIHVPGGEDEFELSDPETVGQVMRFTVVESEAVPPPALNLALFPVRAKLPTDAPTRTKAMIRFRDDTSTNRLRTLDGLQFTSPPTEFPLIGSTEQWDLVNTGEDDDDADAGAHMIHLHLIEFQVLNRQRFDREAYLPQWHLLNGHRPVTRPIVLDPTPFLIGGPIPPNPVETGWKDTVRADPGFVTRIVARWAPQEIPTGGVAPGENRFPMDTDFPSPTDTFSGPGYVWHCHLLGHEDHDMMRPQPVIKAWKTGVSYPVGRVVAFQNVNYRVRQAHTSQVDWEPPKTFALWERVNNNDGTWQPQIIYAIRDRVLHQGKLFEAIQTHQAVGGWEPPNTPALWRPLPMTACDQLVAFVPEGDPDGWHALGEAGDEATCLAVLAEALAKYQFVEPMPCDGIHANPVVFTVPDGTSFTSDAEPKVYETTSELKTITVSSSGSGQKVTVNGREMKTGVNYPLPPQRNHGYCIQTTGGARFTAA